MQRTDSDGLRLVTGEGWIRVVPWKSGGGGGTPSGRGELRSGEIFSLSLPLPLPFLVQPPPDSDSVLPELARPHLVLSGPLRPGRK